MSRPECRGEGLERPESPQDAPQAHCGGRALLTVAEQCLVDRVEALTRFAEQVIEAVDGEGYTLWAGDLREQLRDLTTDDEGEQSPEVT